MAITIVTRYSGDAETIVKVAGMNGPLILKYGATSARLMRVTTGPHVGQHVTAITYDSYAAYEETQAKLAKDSTYKKGIALLQKSTAVQDRSILAEVPY